MEYRRAGKTNLDGLGLLPGRPLEAGRQDGARICSKGRAGSAPISTDPNFEKNRYDVVTQCMERGINYIDACTKQEVIMYAKALKGRRDKMYLGFSWYQEEMRGLSRRVAEGQEVGEAPNPRAGSPPNSSKPSTTGSRKRAWSTSTSGESPAHEQSGNHEDPEMEEMCEALAWAKKTGRARFTGMSSHHRPHIKKWIQARPDVSST